MSTNAVTVSSGRKNWIFSLDTWAVLAALAAALLIRAGILSRVPW